MKSITEREWIQRIEGKEDKILLSNILDSYHRYEKTGIPISSDFLNERELELVKRALAYLKIPYHVYFPVDACERFIVSFGEGQFLSFYRISGHALWHRDVLGALFGCGFSTSMIGDIFVLEDAIYLTNLKKYDSILERELVQIGKHSVSLEKIELLPEISRKFEDVWLTVYSMRFDLIVSKLLNLSRSKTEAYIKTKRVFINYQEVLKVYFLKEQDILSIEGVPN